MLAQGGAVWVRGTQTVQPWEIGVQPLAQLQRSGPMIAQGGASETLGTGLPHPFAKALKSLMGRC